MPTATLVRRVDGAHVLMSDGWVVRGTYAGALVVRLASILSHRAPFLCPMCSLQINNLPQDAKDQVQQAARQGLTVRV